MTRYTKVSVVLVDGDFTTSRLSRTSQKGLGWRLVVVTGCLFPHIYEINGTGTGPVETGVRGPNGTS